MKNQKNKQEEDQKLIQDFLELRPIRATDRLLSENSVERVYEIYNHLQQKIRKNTGDLRSTLTQKYENLVDCSNLLVTIQTFTHEIQAIEKDISHIFHRNPLQNELKPDNQNHTLVNRVQEQLYQKRFAIAMNLSNSNEIAQLQESEKMYLPFLRIQILESLEFELVTKKISERFIVQIISCLQTYIEKLTENEKEQILRNIHIDKDEGTQQDQNQKEQRTQNAHNDEDEGTLLTLLAEALKSKNELDQGDILEIVFKCKLFSLNREEKGIRKQQKINKFFHDIYQLIGEKSRNNDQINRLAEIFCKNLKQIQRHLSQTFILAEQGQIISFQYELYEKLLQSEEFMNILENLHSIIAEHYQQAPQVSLKETFLNLWKNYYQQLLQLLLNRCDPSDKKHMIQDKDDKIPAELKKYFTSTLTLNENLRNYRSQCVLLFKNIKQLLSKTQELGRKTINEQEIMKSIKQFYATKIAQINEKIKQAETKLANRQTQNSLNSLILLFFYCEEFNSTFQKQSNSEHITELSQSKLTWNENIVKQFSQVFSHSNKQKWNINFDRFFMNYNPNLISSSQTEIVRRVILVLIEGMMLQRDQEKAMKLIEECRLKKEKEEQARRQKQGKLADLPKSSITSATFAKKKRSPT